MRQRRTRDGHPRIVPVGADTAAEIRRVAQIGLTEQQIADEVDTTVAVVRRVLAVDA